MALSFLFEIGSADGLPFDGYIMGDLTINGNYGTLSSKNNSRHKMMIILAVSDLLDDVIRLLSSDKLDQGICEFIGADSSFGFWIERVNPQEIAIFSRGERSLIDMVKNEDLVLALWRGAISFYSENRGRIDRVGDGDAALADLKYCMKKFRHVFTLNKIDYFDDE